jgi:plasmid stability protein
MGQLLVRDLDDELIRRLKRRAAAHGRSTEAEHRSILEAAVSGIETSAAEMAMRFQQELTGGRTESADMIRDQRDTRALREPS